MAILRFRTRATHHVFGVNYHGRSEYQECEHYYNCQSQPPFIAYNRKHEGECSDDGQYVSIE